MIVSGWWPSERWLIWLSGCEVSLPFRLMVLGVVWIWASLAQAAESMVISQMIGEPVSAKAYPIIREAYRRLGIDLQTALLPRERSLLSADSGETDGEMIRIAGINAQYINLIRVPEPVFTFDVIAFTAGLKFAVNGWESLRPYSLCVPRGLKAAEKNTEGMQRMVANTTDQAILMLSGGRCQVAILGHELWPDVERLHAGPLRALDPPIVRIPLYHYLNRRHADLVPKLAATLITMRNDGTTAALLAEAENPEIQGARQRNSLPE